jgi:3-oxoadipate enol-lactonase
MPKAIINGLDVFFEDTGGSFPAILFSHSFGMTGAMFAPQLNAFRQTYRCITWDERGHGRTHADKPFDFWDSAKDALALLDHLGVQRAAFVGTSQGGFLAMRAALLAPDRIRGLAILGSSAAAEAAEQRAAYMPMHDAFVAGGASGPPEELIEAMGQICLGDYSDAEPWKAMWRTWPADQFSLAFHALINRDSLLDRLGEIASPVLVMHGTADQSYSPAHAEAIAHGVRHLADLKLVENGAHFLSLTSPDAVNAKLAQFLPQLR